MKKILGFLTLLLISQSSLAQLHIFTCEPEWAALAVTLAGKDVDITSATTSMQDPHTIQARPSMIAKARQADLLICSGAELEVGWLPLLLQKSSNPKIQPSSTGYFMASNYVALLEKGGVADRSAGDIHLAGNPHIQTSPYNMLKVADALLPVLLQLMPEQATQLKQNHAAFTQKMQQALIQWAPAIEQLKGKKVVVHHDNWIYMNQWLGLTKVATLEPKPGVPPTTSHLTGLLMQMKQTPANIIIYASYQEDKPSTWLAEKTGIPAIVLPPTVEKWDEPDALIKWYGQLINTIKKTAS